jgi:hypothetical protein
VLDDFAPVKPAPLDIGIVLSPYAHAPWTLCIFSGKFGKIDVCFL